MDDFDLLVLGSGPSGQKAAIAASKLGRGVAVVERRDMLGGVCINTGTIPSKTLREAVLYLTGLNQREMYGASYRLKDDITVADLSARTSHVIGREVDVIRNQLSRNRISLLSGSGRFVDPHTVLITDHAGRETTVRADKMVIATGTVPARPSSVDFDDATIIDSDGIVHLERVPRSMVVVGAGVIGIEYASMFAALGCKVTVVERRDRMLEFCDLEIVEALKYHLRDLAVTFRFGETVASVERHTGGAVDRAGERQTDRRRHGHVLRRPAGRHRRAGPGRGRPRRRRAWPDQGGRVLPHRGRPHLRRRRRHRLSRAGLDLDGAGPAGRATTPAASRSAPCTSCSPSASTPSPRSASSAAPRTS